MPDGSLKKTAFRFVLSIGIVNLFADMAYEGARANVGPFLATLGANAAIVGLVAGSGELLGYALRSVSGYSPTGPTNTGPLRSWAISLICSRFRRSRSQEIGRWPPRL